MTQSKSTASSRFAGIAITVMLAAPSHASLLECSHFPSDASIQGSCILVESHIATVANTNQPVTENVPPQLLAHTGFQVNALQAGSSSVPDSLLLIILFAALLGVLLIRAKGCNSK